jgi:hypothetical protein
MTKLRKALTILRQSARVNRNYSLAAGIKSAFEDPETETVFYR